MGLGSENKSWSYQVDMRVEFVFSHNQLDLIEELSP